LYLSQRSPRAPSLIPPFVSTRSWRTLVNVTRLSGTERTRPDRPGDAGYARASKRLQRLHEARQVAGKSSAYAAVLDVRFKRIPHRVAFALDRWPLEQRPVLDVGCSYGQALLHFGSGSVGIDNAAEAVGFCRSIGLSAELGDVEADGLDLIEAGAFEIVWVSDVLEHVDAPRLLLRRLAPKLRPNGRLLLHVSVLPRSRLVRAALRRKGMRPFDAEAHFHQFTTETAVHLLARAGYRVERLVVPMPAALDPISRLVPARIAPRVFIEATPDTDLLSAAMRAEKRNKLI